MPAKGVGILDAECPLEAKQVLYTCHGEWPLGNFIHEFRLSKIVSGHLNL
jgi:hypothetical protein